MDKILEAKRMYDDIFSTIRKYGDCVFDYDDLKRKADVHVFYLTLKEKYGLRVANHQIHSTDYNKIGDYKVIGWFGESYKRTISWSVDGRQPENELLFKVGFPTGAFIFGYNKPYRNDDYPKEFFNKFFEELKSFNPDYVDDANHCLYWKIENAKEAFNSFNDVLTKYHELNKEDVKQRKIKEMEDELERLRK